MSTTIANQIASIELTDAELDTVSGGWCGHHRFFDNFPTVVIINVDGFGSCGFGRFGRFGSCGFGGFGSCGFF
ncbi:MAG TPA: hypothetical protein VL485_26015 [Ktedonobacteraceae bacterium]|nr:hypothetical protein [Ktedonobacteraceae bacterium]